MATGKIRMSIRFSSEAYEILARMHPSMRGGALSAIIVKAEKHGWIAEIKQQQLEKVLEGIGMTIDDVAMIRSSRKTSDDLPGDEIGKNQRLASESTGQDESLQEKLDKKIFL